MRKRIFDLDGVFYTFTADFHAATATAMAQAAISLGAKLDLETAKDIAIDSYRAHHFGGYAFVHDHGICVNKLSRAYHDMLDIGYITPDREMLDNFRAAASLHPVSSQAILTQSTSNWPARLSPHLNNIFDLFGAIICHDHCEGKLKSNSRIPFERALEKLNADPKDTDMHEDTIANLKIAKDMGMRTIYVHHGIPLRELPSFVDAQIAQPAHTYTLDAI